MEEKRIMPQHSKLVALLLSFIGGFLDVYCHIQFHTFVATQTGNIILLVADIGTNKVDTVAIKTLSVILFTVGFAMGIYLKEHAKTAFWRTHTMLPMFVSCLLLPFLPDITILWVIVLAFSSGMIMVPFTGSKYEEFPYMIMMTSGNYRKMVSAWYHFFVGDKRLSPEAKRQAVIYSLIVGLFIGGVAAGAIAHHFVGVYAIWIIAVLMGIVVYYYSHKVHKHKLHFINL